MKEELLEGVLSVMKPVDFTSHDVVAKVRRLVGVRRIGHTGTLDPKVTGVLPLCIGRATRLVEYIQELPKEYEAVLTVGYATDTEDATGTVTERAQEVRLDRQQVERTLHSFVGRIEQVPPMYSAVKVDGKRLYQLAREGKEVERKPRSVEVYAIDVLGMKLSESYPEIRFRVRCSKGTYVRTLCTDIGRALGYPAVMSDLVRTATGTFNLDQCLTLDEIAKLSEQGELAGRLIPVDRAVAHLPAVSVSDQAASKALQGRSLQAGELIFENTMLPGLYRLYGPGTAETRRFLGLFRWDEARQALKPEKVFN